jgi:hypothetical protein
MKTIKGVCCAAQLSAAMPTSKCEEHESSSKHHFLRYVTWGRLHTTHGKREREYLLGMRMMVKELLQRRFARWYSPATLQTLAVSLTDHSVTSDETSRRLRNPNRLSAPRAALTLEAEGLQEAVAEKALSS